MDKRKAKAEATKRAIIDAAEKLFVNKGFAATSVSDVAAKANVTKSLIHHHFGSKEALWEATAKKYRGNVERYIDEVLSLGTDSWGPAFFSNTIPGYFDWIRRHQNLYMMQTWLAAERRNPLVEPQPRLKHIFEAIAREQERGIIRKDVDAYFIMLALWAMIETWIPYRRIFSNRIGIDLDSPEADKKYIDAVVKIFLKGISCHDDDKT